MERDVVTHFVRFSSVKQKVFHELFIVLNNISWRNIDFDRSYVIKYERREKKDDKFDMLKHSEQIPYLDFFKCKCKDKREFYPNLWQYDKRYNNQFCPFGQ